MNGAVLMNGRRQAGYTLVELLVVLVLMGIVLMAINSFFLTTYRSYTETSSELRLQDALAVLNEQIAADIRRAELVEINGQEMRVVLSANEVVRYVYDSNGQALFREAGSINKKISGDEIKIENLDWLSQGGGQGYVISWRITARLKNSVMTVTMAESPRRVKI